MPEAPPPAPGPHPAWPAPLVVALLAIAAYANTLGHGFVCDDFPQIVESPDLGSLSNLPRLLTSPYWTRGEDAADRLYRPVTVSTLAMDHVLGGGRPRTFHATNLILHALASLGVYLACGAAARVGRGLLSFPAIAAMLFAVHPIHTDAVNSIVQRSELLAALGLLLAFGAGRRADRAPPGARRLWLVAAGISFALGLGSKENAVVLPLVWLAFDLTRDSGPSPGRARYSKYAVAGLVLGAYLLIRYLVLGGVASTRDAFGSAATDTRLRTLVAVFGDYLRLMLWPHPLTLHYAVNADPGAWPASWSDGRVVAGAVTLAAALVVTAAVWRGGGRALPWLIWVPVSFLPVAGIVPIGTIEAERFCYLPSVGVCAAVGVTLEALMSRRRARLGAVALLVLTVGAGLAATWRRNAVWADDLAFSEAAVADAPGNPWAWWYRGACRLEAGRPEEALSDYTRALGIQPEFPDVLDRRGMLLFELGRFPEAAADFRRILDRMPGEWVIRNNLALSLVRQGGEANLRAAIDEYTHVIEVDGRRVPEVLRSRGYAWMRLGSWREAAADFRACVGLAPGDTKALTELLRCEAALGNAEETRRILRRMREEGHEPPTDILREVEERLREAPH
ncbi:MAG: tetratricopeptide repeat protein [Planctomycetes bacterium]|nr:tetratricopeptide repeat protein [Planctomycetota bacterium]